MDQESLQRRRADRARQRRRRQLRRRLGALGSLAAIAAAIIVVVTLTGGSSTHRRTGSGGPPLRAAAHSATHHRRLAAVAHLGAPTGHPGDATVPILMYHVIAAPPPGAPFPGLYVPRAQFAAQMTALRAAGWHPVTLDELRANWSDGARLPAGRPIVITFDNGYHSQYADALPILRRLGWTADENLQLTGLPPAQGGMTQGEIHALVHDGWELDTQGISHADLITLDAAQLHQQVAVARQTLRRRFGVPVNWFCYPSGHYDPTVVAAVRAAGFVGSTTVVPGWARRSSDPFRLPRLRVLGGTSPSALLSQIATTRGASAPPVAYGSA